MDDDLRKRVEALEQDVARLKGMLTWQPAQESPPPGRAPPPAVQRPSRPGPNRTAWGVAPGGDGRDLESRIGGKWLAMAGMILLVVAVAFFFQLAVQRGWIGLAMQVVLGAAFGLLVWGAGVVMAAKQRLTGFAQVLSAGGIAIVALAVFVAHHVDAYQQATGIGLVADSILLGLLGLGAALDAGLRRVPVQAAAAAALVCWASLAGLEVTSFSLIYTVSMVAALLAVGVWRGWPWMAATAAPAAALVLAVHLIEDTRAGLVLAAACVTHVLVVGAALRHRDIDAGTVAGHVISWASFWIIGGFALDRLVDQDGLAWWSFAVAAMGFLVSFVVKPKALRLAGAIVATVAYVAAPLLLRADLPDIPIWLAGFIAAEILWRSKKWSFAVSLRPVLLGISLMHAVALEFGHIELREGRWAIEAIAVLGVVVAGVVAWHGQRHVKREDQWMALLHLGLAVVTALLLAIAVFNGPTVSVAWAVLGIAAIVAGFLADEMPLRIAGLAIFGAMLVRIVVIDLAGVDAIWRVLAFMGIAAILLFASWLYVRNAAKRAP